MKVCTNKLRKVSVQRIVMVYRLFFADYAEEDYRFRTTNCYGLSKLAQNISSLFSGFPYNELLWFILSEEYGKDITDLFPYNELLWFIFLFALICLHNHFVSVQRIVMVYHKSKKTAMN